MALRFYNDVDESALMNDIHEMRKLQSEDGLCRVVSAEDVRESCKKRGIFFHHQSDSDTQPPAKKRKCVRIQVEPYEVVEPDQLPVDKCCWYSKDDLVRSRFVARKLSRAVNPDAVLMETYHKACDSHPEPSPQSQQTASAVKLLKHSNDFWKQRGLERLSKNHAVTRSIQVCSVKSAVFLEQSSQYLDGIQDPERLAQASRMASRPSQHFAIFLATADQAMADRIHAEAAKTALVLESFSEPKQAVAPTA